MIRSGFKRCPKCSITKSRSDFAKDGASLQSACKTCKAKRNSEWFAAHKDAKVERVRVYRAERPAAYEAHKAVARARSKGEIIKPEHCADCAKAARIEAHHDDYTKPLAVRWLCRPCHRAAHAKAAT